MTFLYPLQQVTLSGSATEATALLQLAELEDINANTSDAATETTLASIDAKVATETTLQQLVDLNQLSVVDQIDTTPLLNVSVSNIPASASLPLEVVSSLASSVKKIISVEDIGEFIGLYTGAASSEVLLCILPLGGGEIQVNIPAATRISLRHMKNSAIPSDFIALNFLG